MTRDEGATASRRRAVGDVKVERVLQGASPELVELWDAINNVVAVSGGNPGCTSVARQHAVCRVNAALTGLFGPPLAEAEQRALAPFVALVEAYAIEGDYTEGNEPAVVLGQVIARLQAVLMSFKHNADRGAVERMRARSAALDAAVDKELTEAGVKLGCGPEKNAE